MQIQTENLFKEIFQMREKMQNNMLFIKNEPQMSKNLTQEKEKIEKIVLESKEELNSLKNSKIEEFQTLSEEEESLDLYLKVS